MSDNKLQKRASTSIKEKGQYALAFGVIASMLLVAGFPFFVIFFFGIFAYFLWKIFSSGSRNESREIFEFYLAANDMLRDDERRWYGFEIHEVVHRGERILQSMSGAPPLVYFTLGALYNKIGDHKSAVHHLGYVLENDGSKESTYMYPSAELRNYVRVLRKIEREPSEAPLTSAAVRALERARKNRGFAMLEESRTRMTEEMPAKREELADGRPAASDIPAMQQPEAAVMRSVVVDSDEGTEQNGRLPGSAEPPVTKAKRRSDRSEREDPFSNRKPISEVLHDIYDRNVQ